MTGTAPIPPAANSTLEIGAFELTVKVAVAPPTAVGANVTVKLHVAFAATACWHPFIEAGMVNNGFEELRALIVSGAFPQFVTVTVWFADVPAFTFPKLTVCGLKHVPGLVTLVSITAT